MRVAPPAAGSFMGGVRKSIPLCLAVGAFGVSFGVVAEAAGWGRLAPIVMSLTTFTGASQFAVVAILGAGGGLAAAVMTGVLLAMRYLPIGVAVAPELRGNALSRFFQSMLVLDESWSLANRGDGTVDRATLLGAGLALYISWQAGTIIGVFGGGLLGDPESLGLDAAFPALFLALLAPKLNTNRTRAAALLGFSIALVLLPFVRPGVPLVAATLGCLVGWRTRPGDRVADASP